jgi:hypothetical protein
MLRREQREQNTNINTPPKPKQKEQEKNSQNNNHPKLPNTKSFILFNLYKLKMCILRSED